jgi:protein TonB
MKRFITITLILQFFLINIYSQDPDIPPTSIIEPDTPFIESEMAEFPGGQKQLIKFINKNIDKEKLKLVDTIGEAIARFSVDSTGQIKNIKIIKPLDPIVDNELIRIIEMMPSWKPGQQYGKPISVDFILPLRISNKKKFCR